MVPLTAASALFRTRYYLVQLNLRPSGASRETLGPERFVKPPTRAQAAARECSVRLEEVVVLDSCGV